ncbi:MAG: O-antigen ligase family protein [Candidatus Omnitrophica bacterium]|nr:O-antigen ligase family protein [Candidatus Omnitrophota bacterium]
MKQSNDERFQSHDLWALPGLLAVLFVLAPMFPQNVYPGFAFFFRSSVFLLFGLTAYRLGAERVMGALRAHPLTLPAVASLLLLFLTFSYTPSLYHAKGSASLALGVWVLYLLTWTGPFSGRREKILLWSLVLGGVLAAVHGLYIQWMGPADLIESLKTSANYPGDMREEMIRSLEANRAMGRFGNPNQLAGCLVLSLWPLWALWKREDKTLSRVILGAGALVLAWGVYRTFSRSGLLVFLISLSLLAGFECYNRGWRFSWKQILAVFGALLILLLIVILAAPGGALGGRLLTVSTIVARLHFFRGAVRIIARHPWFGVGSEGFESFYCAELRPGDLESRYVHNAFLESAVEGGMIGAFFFLWMLFAVLFYLRRQWRISPERRIEVFAAFGAFISLFLLSMVDFHNRLLEMWLVPVFLVGAIHTPIPVPSALRRPRWAAAALTIILVSAWILLIFCRYWNEYSRMDGRYLAMDNQKFAARQAYERAVWFDRTDADSWRWIGLFWAEIPNPSAQMRRLECLRQAVRWAPRRASIRADYAEALFALGYTEHALEEILHAQRLFPVRPIYYERAAAFYRFLNQKEQAENQQQKAVQLQKEIEANRI